MKPNKGCFNVTRASARRHDSPPTAMLQRSRTDYKVIYESRHPANHSLGRIMGSQWFGDGLKGVEVARNCLNRQN